MANDSITSTTTFAGTGPAAPSKSRMAKRRTFTIPIVESKLAENDDKSKPSSIEVTIVEPSDVRADNLTLTTWASSYILAKNLHTLDFPPIPSSPDVTTEVGTETIEILELGAGTGLVGISLAALLERRAVLTDLPGIVPGLRANVDANAYLLKRTSGAKVEVGSLDWVRPLTLRLDSQGEAYIAAGADSDSGTEGKEPPHGPNGDENGQRARARIICAADVIYDEYHPELLAPTIFAWLSPSPSARVLIAWPLRVPYIPHLQDMCARLEAGGLCILGEGRERVEEGSWGTEWDDEGEVEWVLWGWAKTRIEGAE